MWFERGLLALWSVALLAPRELNIRFWHFSFSLTDVIFIVLVSSALSQAFKSTFSLEKQKKPLAAAVLILGIAAAGWCIKGVASRYMFFRDLYIFLIAPLSFLLVSHPAAPGPKQFVALLFPLHTLLAIVSISVVDFEPLSRWYVAAGKYYEIMAGEIGYFMPSGGASGPMIAPDLVRPAVLMGGAGHLGWLTLLGLPLYLLFHDSLSKRWGRFGASAAMVAIILAGLYLVSRSITVGLVLVTALWWMFSPQDRRRKLRMLLIPFTAVAIFVACGKGAFLAQRFISIVPPQWQRLLFPAGLVDVSPGLRLRMRMYEKAGELIWRNPGLGIGMGNNFQLSVRTAAGDAWSGTFTGVDNLYLTLCLKLGLMGLFVVAFLLYSLSATRKFFTATGSQSANALYACGVFCALSGILCAGLLAYPFDSPSFSLIFWSAVALSLRSIHSPPRK